MRVCVRAHACVRVRTCVRACVRVLTCVRACVRACIPVGLVVHFLRVGLGPNFSVGVRVR